MIFRPISKDEFQRLSVAERIEYLECLMADICAKLEEAHMAGERPDMQQNGD